MTVEVVFVFVDFLRNHNTLMDFVDYDESRRNGSELIHMSHESGICLERDMAPKAKIAINLLGLPYIASAVILICFQNL